ncbi:MAG: 7-cyano-7-deazaguanine synthase QueC [Gammaproteobacteria bacterium]|nr:7-cyano-7-deazaguanine synthase QueC [Gammaproteobacteria bacterium]
MSAARAVVLLSGGLDSTTLLAIARAEHRECFSLSLDYGQRHRAELEAARMISTRLGAAEHKELKLDFGQIGGSALTDPALEIPLERTPGIPVTYVPARNTVLLGLALAWAEVLQANEIYIGVNAIDYSGYPDCRPEFVAAFETVARLGTKAGVSKGSFQIRTPLIAWSKVEIILRGVALGIDYGMTVSCYQADADGRACGLCDACFFRREGFAAAGIVDPTRYQGVVANK